MYIGLDMHKKLSYYSMVDGEGTEVKRGRFQTTCEGLASLRASCLRVQKWRSRRRRLVFLRMSTWRKGG